MIYTHEGYEFNIEPDYRDAEIVLIGAEELGYDLVLDASELAEQAQRSAAYGLNEDGYEYDEDSAKYYFDDEGELESFLDVNIDLAERIPH